MMTIFEKSDEELQKMHGLKIVTLFLMTLVLFLLHFLKPLAKSFWRLIKPNVKTEELLARTQEEVIAPVVTTPATLKKVPSDYLERVHADGERFTLAHTLATENAPAFTKVYWVRPKGVPIAVVEVVGSTKVAYLQVRNLIEKAGGALKWIQTTDGFASVYGKAKPVSTVVAKPSTVNAPLLEKVVVQAVPNAPKKPLVQPKHDARVTDAEGVLVSFGERDNGKYKTWTAKVLLDDGTPVEFNGAALQAAISNASAQVGDRIHVLADTEKFRKPKGGFGDKNTFNIEVVA
jgi:hypothetical protein